MKMHSVMLLISAIIASAFGVHARAQETEHQHKSGQAESAPATATTARPNPPAKTPFTEATINLQTTVTGNQEQPRVLYILPWQSPLSGDIEFQTLSSQQDEVFGHLEREELRRSLEAEAALSKDKP